MDAGLLAGLAGTSLSSASNWVTAPFTNSSSTSNNSSFSENWGDSSSYGYTSAWNAANSADYSAAKTYGDLATEWDRVNAERANAIQEAFMLKQQAFNEAEARKSRQWQEYMSNTSYQRAVKDLIAAGLNPILAAGNMGATTPSGATANSGLATAQKATAYPVSESKSNGYSSSSGGSYGEDSSTSKTRGWSTSTGSESSESKTRPAYAVLAEVASSAADIARSEAEAQRRHSQTTHKGEATGRTGYGSRRIF